MAQFEYLLEWHPRGFLHKMAHDESWVVSNVTHHICKDFNDVDEAFNHLGCHNSLWPDERIWAYRFGEEVVLLHMETGTKEKNEILKMKGWC
jgi:hypothetical protein